MTTETNDTTTAAILAAAQAGADNLHIWCNYILETRGEFGSAARGNRARYTGTKVHRLRCEYIVGLVDESLVEHRATMGSKFKATREPVLFSCRPCCGTTQGQHAGAPIKGLTAAAVNCTRCA